MQMVKVILPKEINFRIISLKNEVDNANVFVDVFLSIFVIFVGLLLIIFMKRYIDKNKKDIKMVDIEKITPEIVGKIVRKSREGVAIHYQKNPND